LERHPDCAVVVADAWVVPEKNLDEREKLLSHNNPNRFDRNHFYQCLMSNTIFNAACYMVRMDRFDETHPNRKIYDYKYGSNQQILLPLYYHWNRGFIDEPLSLCVTRPSSLSKLKKTLKEEMEHDLNYQKMLFSLIDGIEMLEEDRLLYKDRVEINVQKDFLLFGINYHDEDLFQEAYEFLKKEMNYRIIKRSLPTIFIRRYHQCLENYFISILSRQML